MTGIPKIVSGGQTGADRAALDWALDQKLPCGGWCPKGRRAEDGAIASRYPLKESSAASYLQRTEWNVRDSDGTIVFSMGRILTGGSVKTVEFARKHNKPCLHIHSAQSDAVKSLRSFVRNNRVKILNVAGPRASKEPKVSQFVIETLDLAFGSMIPADESPELNELITKAERDLALWEESQALETWDDRKKDDENRGT